MKGFTPPSLWGVRLETPPGVGLDRVGGLKEVRQELMDTVLLPAKVSQSEPLAVTRPLHEAASCPLYRGQWASSSRSETWRGFRTERRGVGTTCSRSLLCSPCNHIRQNEKERGVVLAQEVERGVL